MIVEFRQYTLHRGMRETLIELFEREFIESQEAAGMRVVGQFRDLDDPDLFVWMRSFPDMAMRAQALAAFYGGPIWRAHREAANRTMVDSDNVLLLHPVSQSRFACEGTSSERLVVAIIYPVAAGAASDFPDFFERELEPLFAGTGARVLAELTTEHSANNFPALPVREGENVFVCLASFSDEAAYVRHLELLERSARWNEISNALASRLSGPIEARRLAPTARSRLRG